MIGRIEIPGVPIPQARARGGRNGWYDPQATVKRNILDYVKPLIGNDAPISTAISLSITFYMPIPTSLSIKRQKKLIGSPHIKRPDVDNFLKFIFDTLNGVVWKDDCLIYSIVANKIYDENPRTIIKITE